MQSSKLKWAHGQQLQVLKLKKVENTNKGAEISPSGPQKNRGKFNITEHDSIPRTRNYLTRMGSRPAARGKAVLNFARLKMEQCAWVYFWRGFRNTDLSWYHILVILWFLIICITCRGGMIGWVIRMFTSIYPSCTRFWNIIMTFPERLGGGRFIEETCF